MPGIALAASVITVTFLGDGALESFVGVYLAGWRASGAVLAGIGIGAFHLASLVGRLTSARLQRRCGQRRILLAAGTLAALGIAAVVATGGPAPAIGGLLVAGFAIAPIVPAALSLAARSAPGRSGEAVATTTAVGYTAFIAGPILVGAVADVTGLRTALALLIGTSLTVTALALRWPAEP
jgi:MFS family permease